VQSMDQIAGTWRLIAASATSGGGTQARRHGDGDNQP
jgi:hypothetical protein